LENIGGKRTLSGSTTRPALNSPSAITFENNKKIPDQPQTENGFWGVGGGGNGSSIERSLGHKLLINNDVYVLATRAEGDYRQVSEYSADSDVGPLEPGRFMTNIDAALMQLILHIPKRKWESYVHHNRQADDFGRRLEVAKWGAFCHSETLNWRPTRLKPVSSDRTLSG
jgi:hypothetical protein